MTTELTTEDREHIERYTDFKTDSSPITKAMRKALAIIDSQAAALAAEEKNCIALHKANQKQIAIIQEQRAELAERGMTIHEQLVIIATLEEQLAERQKFKDWVHNYLDTHGVPHHPPGTHGEHGCRIGDRMDWLMEQLANKEWECGELRELFRVTDCAVASMSDAADAAAEHFDEDGDLRGDGKWRIRQIHSSVRAIQSEFNRVVVEHSRIKANIAPAAEGGPA